MSSNENNQECEPVYCYSCNVVIPVEQIDDPFFYANNTYCGSCYLMKCSGFGIPAASTELQAYRRIRRTLKDREKFHGNHFADAITTEDVRKLIEGRFCRKSSLSGESVSLDDIALTRADQSKPFHLDTNCALLNSLEMRRRAALIVSAKTSKTGVEKMVSMDQKLISANNRKRNRSSTGDAKQKKHQSSSTASRETISANDGSTTTSSSSAKRKFTDNGDEHKNFVAKKAKMIPDEKTTMATNKTLRMVFGKMDASPIPTEIVPTRNTAAIEYLAKHATFYVPRK